MDFLYTSKSYEILEEVKKVFIAFFIGETAVKSAVSRQRILFRSFEEEANMHFVQSG